MVLSIKTVAGRIITPANGSRDATIAVNLTAQQLSMIVLTIEEDGICIIDGPHADTAADLMKEEFEDALSDLQGETR